MLYHVLQFNFGRSRGRQRRIIFYFGKNWEIYNKMAQPQFTVIRCFLCRRKNSAGKGYRGIDSSICPVSKKDIRGVLQHLANVAKSIIHIPHGEFLCMSCYAQLMDYDATLVKALEKQRNLSRLLEKAALSACVDSDIEQDCMDHMASMEELNDDKFFEDEVISENEIVQTMQEATGGIKKKAKASVQSIIQMPTFQHKLSRELIQCSFCAMKFKSKVRLHKHVSQAHKKFSCNLCSFSHRNEDYVLLHMNLHEGRRENQCRFCEKDFSSKISTIRHMEVHLDSKKYQCDKCGLCFSQNTVLYNHKLQHEAEEHPLRCEICSQVFKTKRTYRHHMITHREDRPRYSCEYCGKTFTEKYTLKVHKRTHPEAVQTTPVEQFQTAANVRVNPPQPLTSSPEAKFTCIICGQVFTSKDSLNKHMEKEHDVILKSLTLTNFTQYEVVTNEPKKPCHICGHYFSAQGNLELHLEQVHGVSFK